MLDSPHSAPSGPIESLDPLSGPRRGDAEDGLHPPRASDVHSRRAATRSVVVLLIYTALAFLLFHLTWQDPSHRLVGGCCDSPAVAWYLRWAGFSVTRHLNPFLSNYAGIRSGFNVMWQPPSMLVVGAVLSPIEYLFGPFVSYNLVITLALSTSGWACYVALRRWVGGYSGPFVGGLLFGFSSFMTAQSLGHPQFTFVGVVPFFFLVLDDLLSGNRRATWKSGLLLGLLAAAEFIISQELSVGLIFAGTTLLIALLITRWRLFIPNIRRLASGLFVSISVCLLVLAWPLATEFFGPAQLHGLLRPQNVSVTDVANILLPNPVTNHFIVRGGHYAFRWKWNIAETGAFVGPALLVVAVVLVRNRKQLFVQLSGITTLVMLILSCGPSLHAAGRDLHLLLPWWIMERLPLLKSALPMRFEVFWQLGVSALIAVGIRDLVTTRRRRIQVVGIPFVLASLICLVPVFNYPAWTPVVPTFFHSSALKQIPVGSTVFVAPFPRDAPYDVSPMLWQIVANLRFKMPGGYILFPAPSGQGLAVAGGTPDLLTAHLDAIGAGNDPPAPSSTELVQMRELLISKYRPQFVLVGPMPGESHAVDLMTALLGRGPEFVGGVYLWKL